MTRVYLPEGLSDVPSATLPESVTHYLATVVRLRAGDEIGVFDGHGHEWRARIAAVTRRSVDLVDVRIATPVPEPVVRVTVGVGLLKGEQMDDVVRDLTALGAARIVPLITDHVAVSSRAWRGDRARERWHRVAAAAAAQCGRAVVPLISDATPLAALLEEPDDYRLAAVEPGAPGLVAPAWTPVPGSALLLVGPEGGWSAAELEQCARGDVARLSLGPRTLRAELAPAVALATVWAAWEWLTP
ncbi:MAG: ribosomal RNA small subunit methyltransferase E [Acidimicrobiia bacterium]